MSEIDRLIWQRHLAKKDNDEIRFNKYETELQNKGYAINDCYEVRNGNNAHIINIKDFEARFKNVKRGD